MAELKVNLCGIELDNPIIPASGCFGYGYEFAELYDINCLGTFSFKGTTKDPRFGNPTPRIAECTAGMINAVGLQNPGVEKVISEELPKLKQCFHKPVMANVSGFSVEDYAYTCEKLNKEEQVGWLEVNVSCPNVHGGGMSFLVDVAHQRVIVLDVILKIVNSLQQRDQSIHINAFKQCFNVDILHQIRRFYVGNDDVDKLLKLFLRDNLKELIHRNNAAQAVNGNPFEEPLQVAVLEISQKLLGRYGHLNVA